MASSIYPLFKFELPVRFLICCLQNDIDWIVLIQKKLISVCGLNIFMQFIIENTAFSE